MHDPARSRLRPHGELGFSRVRLADANLDWSPGIAGALLGALLGALIGGLLTGAVQWRLERRREEAQAKDGARPLRVELSLAKGRVESAIEELLWWPFYEMAFEPWDRYRDVLAVDLDPEGWDSVTQSVAQLRALSEGMENAPGDPSKPRPLGPKTGRRSSSCANIIRAFNALRLLADDDEEMEPSAPPRVGAKSEASTS